MSRRLVVFMLDWVTQGREVWHKWRIRWRYHRKLTAMHRPETHGLDRIDNFLP